MRMQLVPEVGRPDFLDLPWKQPLADWTSERLVQVVSGIHRHVVRFVDYGGALYVLKELPQPLAEREYRLLRALAHDGEPVVEAVGIVVERPDQLDAVLITRYLDFSLPYRILLRDRFDPAETDRVLDAFAGLLVRLHLAGFFWGDCSLSNTLFRRDAGALSAYLVDAETGELHDQVSDGQRRHDLDIAEENFAGELFDLAAERDREPVPDPFAVAANVRGRYERLWAELTADEIFSPDERFRLEERLRRLNELGFDAEEVELLMTEEGYRLRLHSKVVEPGHHRRRLLRLTGLQAQENQARRLLNDITAFRAQLERSGERPVSDAAVAGRWLTEIFEPAVAAVPAELQAKRDAAELFHELLEHRWYLSEAAGRDIGLEEATRSYVDSVLPDVPDERAAVLDELPPPPA